MVAAIGKSRGRSRRLVELSLGGLAILFSGVWSLSIRPAAKCSAASLPKSSLIMPSKPAQAHSGSRRGSRCWTGALSQWSWGRAVSSTAARRRYRHLRNMTRRKSRQGQAGGPCALRPAFLPNRLLFFDRLQQAMHEAKRCKIAPVFPDPDRLKQINDTLGHADLAPVPATERDRAGEGDLARA